MAAFHTETSNVLTQSWTFCGEHVSVSAWLLRYTDWFETFAGLLALGGVLSWLAFISRAIPDDRLKSLQGQIVGVILESRRTWKVVLSIVVLLFALSFCLGSLQVEGGKGGFDARIQVYSVDRDRSGVDSWYLPANGRVRSLWWTNPFGSRQLSVKLTSLPEARAHVIPWWRPWWEPTKQVAPMDFYRPVVLVGADRILVNEADRAYTSMDKKASDPTPTKPGSSSASLDLGEIWLVARVGNDRCYRTCFDGRSIWIGCQTGDLEAQGEVFQEALRNSSGDPKAASLQLSPRNPGKEWPNDVDADSLVVAYLLRKEQGKVNRISTVERLRARKPGNITEIVQALLLRARSDDSDKESPDDKAEDFKSGGCATSGNDAQK